MLLLTQGNALKIPLADESVHCVVTSPPYWGLRDYGIGGQLGLEPTPEEYVANMVAVFREVRRVLRADGTCWLNLGDSYAGSPGQMTREGKGKWIDEVRQGHSPDWWRSKNVEQRTSLKPKDLCGIPWRVAFALQADGWWLRSDIIWSKPNPMPESVTDRPTKSHEYLFLLSKSKTYYYDAEAIREPLQESTKERGYTAAHLQHGGGPKEHGNSDPKIRLGKGWWDNAYIPSGRNKRTVWHIATAPYSGAHFATYPPALVEPCIKAGTSERGVCPECGKPWERVVEHADDGTRKYGSGRAIAMGHSANGPTAVMRAGEARTSTTLGWQPTCACVSHDPIPDTVFDPFAGSGTTLQVARQLGRNGVGLDLSLEYLHLARQRLSLDALENWGKGKKDGAVVTDLPMFQEMP